VGDFLGDNDARINLFLAGGGVLKDCSSDSVRTWAFGSDKSLAPTGVAMIQAGVNGFGDVSANTSLFGAPVAGATWRVQIPGGTVEPANADVDVSKVEDIVLKVHHKALPQKASPVGLDISCLANVGG
jgi:hypothetical protein